MKYLPLVDSADSLEWVREDSGRTDRPDVSR
jgi:hypothetical protein